MTSSTVQLTRCPDLLLVLNTPKGRGIFATRPIPARTIVDVSPVLVIDPAENEQHIQHTGLVHYTYTWPHTPPTHASQAPSTPTPTPTSTPLNSSIPQTQALPLGLGSLFNHSSHTYGHNIGWTRDTYAQTITYTTLRDIAVGEELCINYGARLTFADVEAGGRRDGTGEGDVDGAARELGRLVEVGGGKCDDTC